MVKFVDGKEPLYKHHLFWVCIMLPIGVSLGLAFAFGLFDLSFDFSPNGVIFFYEHSKLFLAVAALSIPLGATFSRVHASKQTADSLSIALDQNKKLSSKIQGKAF